MNENISVTCQMTARISTTHLCVQNGAREREREKVAEMRKRGRGREGERG